MWETSSKKSKNYRHFYGGEGVGVGRGGQVFACTIQKATKFRDFAELQ